MEPASRAYQRIIMSEDLRSNAQQLYQQLRDEAEDQGMDYDEVKRRHCQEFENLYLPQDLKVICDMLEHGYSMREVTEAYTDQNLFARDIKVPELVKIYEDKVLSRVNDERKKRSGQEFDRARNAYEAYRQNNGNKYDDHDDAYQDYREGEVIIAMMVKDGYSEQTIADVLEARSDYDSAYIKSIMEKCGHVKQAYLDIRNAPDTLDDARNGYDVYRIFAKRYMDRTGAKLLNYDDDIGIVKDMKEQEFPEELLQNVLLHASPVAKEPGRNPSEYVKALLAGEEDREELKEAIDEPVLTCEEQYKDLIEEYDKDLKERGHLMGIQNANRPYYDCLAVRELLSRHYMDDEIMQALNEQSGVAASTRPNYALWLVEKAKKLLKKEQNLLHEKLPDIQKGLTYAALAASGISAAVIMASILRERLALNPSLEQHLFAAYLDKDLAEACLNRYPDFDKEALAGALADSPRAIILSGSRLPEEEQYAEHVIQAAEKRLESHHKSVEQQKSIFEEFNKQHGLAYQGVAPQDNLSAFHCGRTALQMMLKGYEPLAIREAILATETPDDRLPETFADEILERTHQVYDRLMRIKNYHPEAAPKPQREDAKSFYERGIYEQYQKRHFIKSSMDVDVVKAMLAYGKFNGREIREALQELSPIAIEPGRDASYYQKYVLPNAKNRLMDEKDKLNQYHPVPRKLHADTAQEEYAYHRSRIQDAIDLPYNPQMDALIAETMLIQGFAPPDIAEAMQNESPCRGEQSDYGVVLVNHARFQQANDEEQQEEERGASRVRTYTDTVEEVTEEVTTTTTTETTIVSDS